MQAVEITFSNSSYHKKLALREFSRSIVYPNVPTLTEEEGGGLQVLGSGVTR